MTVLSFLMESRTPPAVTACVRLLLTPAMTSNTAAEIEAPQKALGMVAALSVKMAR